MAFPAQAAVQASASMSLTSLEVPAGTSLSGHALLLGAKPTSGEQVDGWEFRADHVRVDVQHDQGIQVFAVVPKTQPSGSGEDLGPTYGFTTAVGSGVYMTIAGEAMAATTVLPALSLQAVTGVHFANSQVASLVKPPADADAPAVDLAHPAIESRIGGTAPIVLRGDLRVFLYSFNFTLKPDGGAARDYSTGFNRDPQPAQGLAGESDDGRATLVLTNATFTYRPGAAPYQLDLADATLGLAGSLRLHDAQGSLEAGGQSTPLAATTLTLDFASGMGALHPAAATGEARMEGDFTGSLQTYAVDGRSIVPEAAVVGGVPVLRAWTWPVAVAAVVAVAGAALVVRRRRGDVDLLVLQAEEAFLHGRFDRALAVSVRAVRRAPMDMDAVVLRCLARLRLGESKLAAVEIDGILGSARPLGDPGTLHLLLSMCRMESGEDEGAKKALARALAIRPDLGEEVRRSPLFRRVLEQPELRALLGHDPAASYA